MRLYRLLFILMAFYITFIGGSTYYNIVPVVRVFHHGVMTVVLGLWLLHKWRRSGGVPATPLNAPVIAALVTWLVSSAASIDPRAAVENVWLPLNHVVIFLILADMFQTGRQKWVMEAAFILGGMIVFITGLEVGSWYWGWGIIPGTEVGWASVALIPPVLPRVTLALNVSTWLAAFVAPLMLLALAWALTVRRSADRRVLWVLAAALGLVLLLTSSRGGWLSLGTGFAVFVVMRLLQDERLARWRALRWGIAAVVIVGIVGGAALLILRASDSRRSGDEVRLDLWRSAAQMTLDYPALGVGPGNFGRAWRDYRQPAFARDHLPAAHNALLNTSSETGLVGVGVSLWLAAALALAWRRRWQAADTTARRIRLEAAMAALLGIGVHSMVDVFTPTPVVLPLLCLAAYCVTGHRSALAPVPPRGLLEKALTAVLLALVVGYGLWFALRVDPAYLSAASALRTPRLSEAIASVENARSLDPALRLYDLLHATLLGIQADLTRASDDIAQAIAAYQRALALEPTWDGGWINLAGLYLLADEPTQALAALDTARGISEADSPAVFHWARTAEAIISAYAVAIANNAGLARLPVTPFWQQTPLRWAAVERFLAEQPIDVRYYVLSYHRPDEAAALVPAQPLNAREWWVLGRSRLASGDAPGALSAFATASALDPTNGDYYLAQAQAQQALRGPRPDSSRNMALAALWGTTLETLPGQVRDALSVNTGLSYVLYAGRVIPLDLLPAMRATE
jgi:O-antigen ligase/cytochrome c-type biogenesis protein CcmH/NrfG